MTTHKQGIQMHEPAHPGEVIRETCLKPLGLSVTAAAEGLGVTRKALSELLNGHSGVSPEMALRLAAAGWSTAETWLQMQLAYDLWQVRRRTGELNVKPFPAAA
jgi:antitoxin HigA-1